MTMNYTKGKWNEQIDTEGRVQIMSFGGDKSSEVGMVRNVCALSVRPPDETEANAHLISATPNMYEALKETNDILGLTLRLIAVLGGERAIQRAIQRTIDKNNKALAKAAGKGE